MQTGVRNVDDADVTVFEALTTVVCERLNMIIDKRTDVIQPGKSRIPAFALVVDVHYNTANRLLKGEILPSAVHLCRIAKEFGVTESWLLGRGEIDDYNGNDSPFYKVQIFDPNVTQNEHFITIPIGQLPLGLSSDKLVFTQTQTEMGETENVVVKLSNNAHDGKVHLIYDSTIAARKTYMRRINVIEGRDELVCFTLETGQVEIHKFKDVVFGLMNGTDKLSIMGPVLARIQLTFKGD